MASLAIDLVCIFAALVAAWLLRGPAFPQSEITRIVGAGFVRFSFFAAIWALVTYRLDTYSVSMQQSRRFTLLRMTEAWGTTWGFAGLASVTMLDHAPISIWLVLPIGWALLVGIRLLLVPTAVGRGGGRLRTLVVGASANARRLSSGRDASLAAEIVGFVPFPGDDPKELPHLEQVGTIGEVEQVLVDRRCTLALVCPTGNSTTSDVHRVFRACDELGLGIHYFPPFLDLQHLRIGLYPTPQGQGLVLSVPQNHGVGQAVKRFIDVVGASLGLLVLLPVFISCAIAVKLSSPGAVFFRQRRVGKNGETFTCLKFRTMRVGAHAQQELLRAASTQDGPAFKIPDDPRVTPAGRFLRKFSLDELPQLLNVLVGDMSIVGPRPPIPSEVAKYTWWQRRRIAVKPGLTCVWQVWGRNRVSFKRWVEMDIFYIDNWSVWLDLKLIAHTFRAVLHGTGM
ncbi:MAG: sugar transferase [Planctomycetota bacterium]